MCFNNSQVRCTAYWWASALAAYDFDVIYRAGFRNADAGALSRYNYEVLQDKNQVNYVRAMCAFTQFLSYIYVLPVVSIDIVKATDSSSQLAQTELKEIRKQQREENIIAKWVWATTNKQLPAGTCTYTNQDRIMKNNFNKLKMFTGTS